MAIEPSNEESKSIEEVDVSEKEIQEPFVEQDIIAEVNVHEALDDEEEIPMEEERIIEQEEKLLESVIIEKSVEPILEIERVK